jgi:hypothetical protein
MRFFRIQALLAGSNAMAIALFPLNEGESIGSNIGRYADFIGLKSTVMLRCRLFGYRSDPRTRLPSGIARLIEETRDYWRLGAEAVIEKHTEFRYITMTVSRPLKEGLLADMLDPPAGFGSRRKISGSIGERVTNFRYCEECLAEWRGRKITPYWRIDHQLPGVYACFRHSIILKAVRTVVEEKTSDPTVVSAISNSDENILRAISLTEENAVKDVAIRSARQRLVGGEVTPVQKYRDLLRIAGFVHPDARVKADTLISGWMAYFGPEYCGLTNMSAVKITSWLSNLSESKRDRQFVHPFMFVAAESFLEHHASSPGSFAPAKRNNSEMVGRSTSSNQPVIPLHFRSLTCSGVLHRNGDIVKFVECLRKSSGWKLVCSCGLSYRILDESHLGPVRLTPINYGARYRNRFHALMAKGDKAGCAARKLRIGQGTAASWAHPESRENSQRLAPVRIRQLRSKWRRLVRSAPSAGRVTSAHQADPGLYKTLRLIDNDWLLNFNRQNRTWREGRKITWDQIQEAYFALVRAEPPVRATKTAILEKLGALRHCTIRGELRLLLAELAEPRLPFRERVISWLVGEVTKRHLRSYAEVARVAEWWQVQFTKEERILIRIALSLNIEANGLR